MNKSNVLIFIFVVFSTNLYGEVTIESDQYNASKGDGFSCVECVFISYGPVGLVEELQGEVEGEINNRYRITIVRSEIYHSIGLEKITNDDRLRPRRFISEVWFFSNQNLSSNLGFTPHSVFSFDSWIDVDTFLLDVGADKYEVDIVSGGKLEFRK